MALGANVRDVLRLVVLCGLRLTIAGIVIGAATALLLTRLMGNLLCKVSPARSNRIRRSLNYFDRRCPRRLFSPGPPCDPNRSRPRSADLISSFRSGEHAVVELRPGGACALEAADVTKVTFHFR